MPAPTGPQFESTNNIERYGNRYGELSKEAQTHINTMVNSLASHGGGIGLSIEQITGITSDPHGQHGPFFDTPEKQADAIDRVLGFDPHLMGDFWEGDENPDMNEEGPDYNEPDPFGG